MTTRTFIATVGTPIALVAILAATHRPALFLWYAALAWFLLGAGGIASALMQGGRVVELEKAGVEKDRKAADLEAEAQRLHLLLTEAQIAAGDAKPLPRLRVVDRPDLRVTPPQRRSDSWLEEVMDEQARLGEQQEGGAS